MPLCLELLDNLVYICYACGLLDLVHGFLEPLQLFLLLLASLLRLVLLVDTLQPDVVLHLLLVIELLVSLLSVLLLHHLLLVVSSFDLFGLVLKLFLHKLLSHLVLLLELLQLVLCDFLRVLSVVGKKLQFVEVVLFAFQALLDGCELVLVSDSLVLESLHNHLICFPDALSFVVLDHSFVELVLKHSDLAHLRIVLRVEVNLLSVDFLLFVFQISLVGLELLGQR